MTSVCNLRTMVEHLMEVIYIICNKKKLDDDDSVIRSSLCSCCEVIFKYKNIYYELGANWIYMNEISFT